MWVPRGHGSLDEELQDSSAPSSSTVCRTKTIVRPDDSWQKVQTEELMTAVRFGYGFRGSVVPRQPSKGKRRNSKLRQQWMAQVDDPSTGPDVDFEKCKAVSWKRKAGQDRLTDRRRARTKDIAPNSWNNNYEVDCNISLHDPLPVGPVFFNLAVGDSDEAETEFFPGKVADTDADYCVCSVAVLTDAVALQPQTNTTASQAATIQWQ
jgi:hypothetical protein